VHSDPAELPPAGPAYAAVAARLRAQILSGALPPGARLPNEQELSAEFGVGRSTVREALRALSSQNLIETVRGVAGGSFVAVPTVGHVSAHLETGMTLMAAADAVTVEQLMTARRILEVPVAGAAAQQRTAEHLDRLRAAQFDPSGAEGPETYAANQAFHLVLLRAADNPLLEVVTAPLFRVLSHRFGRDRAPDGFWQEVADDHAELFQRVESGDADGARDAMRRHLDHLTAAYVRMDRLRTP
jgi:GntR family transcriptional regulator, transcriptional repressor for pyruvate dehydrogenase complex